MGRCATAPAGSKSSSWSGNGSPEFTEETDKMEITRLFPHRTEEPMGKSHQAGWVSLRGKQWYGYFRQWVLDPETNEERVKKICIKLASNQNDQARSARSAACGNHEGDRPESRRQSPERQLCNLRVVCSQPLFPIATRDWRPETAKEKMAQIELDLIARFGDHPLDTFDRFMLQTHVNGLADRTHRTGSSRQDPI